MPTGSDLVADLSTTIEGLHGTLTDRQQPDTVEVREMMRTVAAMARRLRPVAGVVGAGADLITETAASTDTWLQLLASRGG